MNDYDAGLLADYGGGDVAWWQDYLRAEIGRANEHWREQLEAEEPADTLPANARFVEVEKPHPDSLRLDWLEAHGEEIRLTYQRGWPTMDNSAPPKWRFWCYSEGTTTRPTVREALDAAMSAPSAKGAKP